MHNCLHLWLLDYMNYFYCKAEDLTRNGLLYYFPAQCQICKEKKNFDLKEWLEHK